MGKNKKRNNYWEFSRLEIIIKIKKTDSDLFSTWLRLIAIALIEITFSDICIIENLLIGI
jgi:hypothetical protein